MPTINQLVRKGRVTRKKKTKSPALEINYNEVETFQLGGMPCMRTTVEEGPWLSVNPQNIVTIVWGKDEEELHRGLQDKRLLDKGVHPIYVL